MILYTTMLKKIAEKYVETSYDGRGKDEVYGHMHDRFKRNLLDKKFVNDAYDAIMGGKFVMFSYLPGRFTYCFVAGSDKKAVLETLWKIRDGKLGAIDVGTSAQD